MVTAIFHNLSIFSLIFFFFYTRNVSGDACAYITYVCNLNNINCAWDKLWCFGILWRLHRLECFMYFNLITYFIVFLFACLLLFPLTEFYLSLFLFHSILVILLFLYCLFLLSYYRLVSHLWSTLNCTNPYERCYTNQVWLIDLALIKVVIPCITVSHLTLL